MVYLTDSGPTWKLRVVAKDGTARVVSTGTTDRDVATDIEAMVRRFKKRRQWAALDAIVHGRLPLGEVYDADCAGTLDALLARREAADLSPMVAQWASEGADAKYVAQVRRLIPAGRRFPVTGFTRARISTFLATLTRHHRMIAGKDTGQPASDRTKNRHRAALSAFAGWLIEREVIDANPVRDVKARRDPGPQEIHLTPKQARALVAALPRGQQQALEAWMAGTGVELGALLNARRRDVDATERTLHCFPGYESRRGKTKYRGRVVEVTEDWCWPYIEAHLAGLPPNARLFTLDEDAALRAHDRVVKALGLPPVTLHDWRHTYAVTALKRKDDHQDIKRQLGHAPQSTLLYDTYGVYTTKPKGRTARLAEAARKQPTPPAPEPAPTGEHA